MFRQSITYATLSLALFLVSQKDANAGFLSAHDDGWQAFTSGSTTGAGSHASDSTPTNDEGDRDSHRPASQSILASVAGATGGMSTSSTDDRAQSSAVGSVAMPVGLTALQCGAWVWVAGHPRLPSARETMILDPPRTMAAG